MIGFDLAPRNPEEAGRVVNAFMYGCRERGVHLTYGYQNVNFRVIPPLVITRAEIDRAIGVIEEALQEASEGGNSASEAMPRNPYTRRLVADQPWRRLIDFCWRASPEDLIEKSREVLRKRFGAN
jgi:hypothetical protein